MNRLCEFEYFKTVVDILINAYASNLFVEKLDVCLDKILESKILEVAISSFFEFEFNNLYQKLFEQLIILINNKYTPGKLVKKIYEGCDFLNAIVNKCEQDLKFKFDSGKQINTGIFALLCDICMYIIQSENTALIDILHSGIKVFLTKMTNLTDSTQLLLNLLRLDLHKDC